MTAIRATNLSKRYGKTEAVTDLSFDVEPGQVTGFLGPNGAGKSTSMRLILGLDRPSAGTVTVNGKRYTDSASPLTEVGALLDAKGVHPGRSARSHLRAIAATHGISDRRVGEVLAQTGLESVAHKRVGGYSLGMGQRLGIAAALLGDPQTLILDEPVNGLDPEGVLWVRNLVRYLAGQGRTVFLSSHLMSEMAITADDLVVIGRGRIITTGTVQDIITASTTGSVRVRSPRAGELAEALRRGGVTISSSEPDRLDVTGIDAPAIGELAAQRGIPLHELTPVSASLEEAFMTLTAGEVEYHSEAVGDPDTRQMQEAGR